VAIQCSALSRAKRGISSWREKILRSACGGIRKNRWRVGLPLDREPEAERLRGVYSEPVEGLAMTEGRFSAFYRFMRGGDKISVS